MMGVMPRCRFQADFRSFIVLLVIGCGTFYFFSLLKYPHNPGLGARDLTYISSLVPASSPETTNHAVATAGTNDDHFNRPKANAPWQQRDSKLQAVPGADQHCMAGRQDPVKGFYFVKVAKTGTTTICSMMTRFIRLNNLSVLTPVKGYAVQWWKERNIGWRMKPERNLEKADVLVNHAVYNITMVEKYIKPGYKLIVPVREPVSWFKSAVNFRFRGKVSLHRAMDREFFYSSHGSEKASGRATPFHLAQLTWLGFNYEQSHNDTAIKEFINWIVSRVDVIMLKEQFTASLLILRRRFCWSYKDIFFKIGNVKNSARLEFEDEDKAKLIEWNYGEFWYYEAMNRTWWSQDEVKSGEIFEEAKYFTSLNARISQLCHNVLSSNKNHVIQWSRWHQRLTLTPKWCRGFSCIRAMCTYENGNCIYHRG